MAKDDPDRLAELLAGALAAYDDGGDAALAAFVARHPADRTGLERGLARCRQMGLLGPAAPVRDFPEQLGEFRLLRRLGSGGMGVVYEAEQASLGRRVALKVVRPELLYFEGARERFRREVEAVARLSHPAVVPVLASGEQDGVPWYAMELLRGRSVHDVCNALAGRDPATLTGGDLREVLGITTETGTDPFSGVWWQLCTRIAHTVAIGVRHAHLRGIVHRDIKPSNVMLTTDGRTVLLDFGVAMVGGGREFTRTGNTPGSPAFMSPEQLRGDAVDERTDVYSLAATLWQMLTLVPPFPPNGALQRLRDAEPPGVLPKNRQVPRELDLVVRKAMDPDRERRYHDAEAFAEDLQAVLQRRPIRARQLGLSLRLVRWCQRHRVAATALGCLCLAALSLPTLFAWRERATNRALEASARLAEESLDTTLDAIYGLLVRVSDNKLRYVPAMSSVALDALQEACAMYRGLRPKHPGNDRLRLDSSKALTRLGELLARNGRSDEAAATFREAVDVLDDANGPLPPLLRDSRAIAWLNLANTLNLRHEFAPAAAAIAAAEQDCSQLPDDSRSAMARRRIQLQIEMERANALDPQTETTRHEGHLRRALELAREVVAAVPDDLRDQSKLISVIDTLATALSKNSRFAEAEPLLQEALSLVRAMPADARIFPPPKALEAEVAETLGNLYVQRRDQRAADLLKLCLQRREELVQTFPDDISLRSDHAAAIHNLASMNFYQAQDDLALERVDRAIELQRQVVAASPSFQQGHEYLRNHLVLRGSTLAKLERRPELEAVATELGGFTGDRNALRSAARLWLRAAALLQAEAPPAADATDQHATRLRRALDLLLQAEQLGWGGGNPFAQKLYDPLRGFPEFDALQQRIAARKSLQQTSPK